VSAFIVASIVIDHREEKNDVLSIAWGIYEIPPIEEENGIISFSLEMFHKNAILTYYEEDKVLNISSGLLVNNLTIFLQDRAFRIESISAERLVISAVPADVYVNESFQIGFVIVSSRIRNISYELRLDNQSYGGRDTSAIKGRNIIQESLRFDSTGIHRISIIMNSNGSLLEIYVWVNVIEKNP
jgi:hypothetical protein